VNVDLEQLADAFEDASAELNYFVDRETGDVVLVSETLGFIEAGQQRFEMDLTPGRYLSVPAASTFDFEDDMDAFLERVDDDDLAVALENALDDVNPSKRIEVLLGSHPEIAANWKRFRRERIQTRARKWVDEHGLSVGS
jgi:uncharacterized protein UPF0158